MSSESGQLFERGVEDVAEADNTPLEWRGLPAFIPKAKRPSLVLAFESEEDRDALLSALARLAEVEVVPIAKKTGPTWSAPWPPREKEDLAALRFDFGEGS